MSHHYNPDWLSEEALLASFVARQNDFAFMRAELARAPLQGNVQHYLLVGVRGAGKTTLLKRLAVAIRREPDLNNHLLALSFPEELYQVKNLSDFWWAACEALVDELDHLQQSHEAEKLLLAIDQIRKQGDKNNLAADAGFKLLQDTCAALKKRPVMLVDNLDLVFDRIDKSGRKLKDPHSPAYWALREALSTTTSPIVIGGSVRLSDAFIDYDKAFYDFFLPKRLGKLSLDEVHSVLEHLADAQNQPEVKERLRSHPARVEALYELTGGNPRALGLIFELLRNGPNSRAVEDFERLMDITTPYYKARIEELSEQAQVIMHALAVNDAKLGLRFGHTAAEIASYTDLPTTSISAQLSLLENEGLVEKSPAHGRTQYRITEQMFRLWLQMRATRRIRQNVISLAKFFEAMYEQEELQAMLKEDCGVSALSQAKYAFAVASTTYITEAQRRDAELYGKDRMRDYLAEHDGDIRDYLPDDNDTLIGEALDDNEAVDKLLAAHPHTERQLIELGFLLIGKMERYEEGVAAFRKALAINDKNPHVWRILSILLKDKMNSSEEAEVACRRAIELEPNNADHWRGLGIIFFDNLHRFDEAKFAFLKAVEFDRDNSENWKYLGMVLSFSPDYYNEAEKAFRKAMELSPNDPTLKLRLGIVLSSLQRHDEAEVILKEAILVSPENPVFWQGLGVSLMMQSGKLHESELAVRRSIELDPYSALAWQMLGAVLELQSQNEDALIAYKRSVELKSEEANKSLLTLLTEICVELATKAITSESQSDLHNALKRLVENSTNIVAALLSMQYVENFLARLLAKPKSALLVLKEMRNLGYEKHARPLILAFEAALEGREDMLTELEPELQGATMHMYKRLTGN